MKKFFNEFKEFISRGSVLDMAVGIIIGGAFTAIVTALNDNILSPILNVICGGISFDAMFVEIKLPWVKPVLDAQGNEIYPTIHFGNFLQAIITFLITAFALFLIIKGINGAKKLALKTRKQKPEPEPDATTKICPYCKSEVDIEATRCRFCTSELELEYVPEEEAAATEESK